MRCAAQVSDTCRDHATDDVLSTCSILSALATGCTFATCCDAIDKRASIRGPYKYSTHADSRGESTKSSTRLHTTADSKRRIHHGHAVRTICATLLWSEQCSAAPARAVSATTITGTAIKLRYWCITQHTHSARSTGRSPCEQPSKHNGTQTACDARS